MAIASFLFLLWRVPTVVAIRSTAAAANDRRARSNHRQILEFPRYQRVTAAHGLCKRSVKPLAGSRPLPFSRQSRPFRLTRGRRRGNSGPRLRLRVKQDGLTMQSFQGTVAIRVSVRLNVG